MADKDTNVPNKNDFISREAAIALTDQHCFETSYDAVWMEEELRKLPAADVRPVVPCRDCRWWTKQEKSLQGRCKLAGFYPTGAWFCANGERSNCGTDMRGTQILDTTKGDGHD